MKIHVSKRKSIGRFLAKKNIPFVICRYIWQNKEKGFVQSIKSGFKILLNPPSVPITNSDESKNVRALLDEIKMLLNNQMPSTQVNKLSPTLIIIPIFNGFDFVGECIKHALETPSIHKVLAVDDCSTDPRIFDMLQMYKIENPERFDWVQTSTNMGFPGAVNLGLLQAESRDVLLLNSDAIIPANLIEQMNQAFISNEKIASVTPLTNSGTIASIPLTTLDSDIPESAIHREFQALLRDNHVFQNPKNWPVIPTAVGFAMLINGGALQEIGSFDERAFSPGYGEEVDWSQRAIICGYTHLLCPTTFAYHAGGGSYGPNKLLFIQQHSETINLRYPMYQGKVQKFFNNDPLQSFREAIFLAGISKCKELRVDVVIDHQQGGGATKVQDEEFAANPDIFYVILSKATTDTVHWAIKFRNISLTYSGSASDFLEFAFLFELNKIILNTIALVIDADFPTFASGVVLPLIMNAQTSEFRLHDYHSICPSLNLINNQGSFCDIPDVIECGNCLPKNPFKITTHAGSILEWRKPWDQIFQNIEIVICFSNESRERVMRVFPQVIGKTVVRHHKVFDYSRALTYELMEPNLDSLRIATIGTLHYAKGSQVVIGLARAIKGSVLNHKIEHFGNFNIDVPSELPIVIHGKYRDSRELILQLKQLSPDVILVPSIWPETFSIVAEEIKSSLIPIVMFDMGAPFERHKDNESFNFIKPIFGLELLNEISRIVEKSSLRSIE